MASGAVPAVTGSADPSGERIFYVKNPGEVLFVGILVSCIFMRQGAGDALSVFCRRLSAYSETFL